jgi:hypothetical protein
MSESRISGRLDVETFELYEKLRDETGFTGQRKDTRFLKSLLSLLQDLQKRGMLAVSSGPSPILALGSEVAVASATSPEPGTQETVDTTPETAEQLLSSLDLREQEYQEIMQACERSYGSLDELLRVGVLNEARKSNMLAEKTTQFDFTDATQRGRRRGAGYAYVESTVQQLMETNLQSKNSWDMLYITRGQVAKLTGTNRADINTYFDNHRDMLEEHHKSLGFTSVEAGESHNRLRAQQMKAKNAREAVE